MSRNLNKIIQHLLDATQPNDILQEKSLSLLGGLPGNTLFHWYAAKYPSITVDVNKLEKQIQSLAELAPVTRNTLNFGRGIVGLAWLFELLLTESDDGYDPSFNQAVEDMLITELQECSLWDKEIELVLGLSGIAIFAARRLKQQQGLELYDAIVKIFSRLAVYPTSEQCSWPAPVNSIFRFEKDPNKTEYNLGLAHGMPAVICALLPAVNHPRVGKQAAKLVSDGCNWLVAQQHTDKTISSRFPFCCGDRGPSRLGWCYGDLTIALTLARAGKALERDDLLKLAHEIGLHAAARDEESAMVRDAGLCHGSAGLMLLFQLLGECIPDPAFAQASDYWFENTMKRYEEQGLQGFYAYRLGEYVEETSFLEGFSGIGLCLLARQGISPDWVDALLLA